MRAYLADEAATVAIAERLARALPGQTGGLTLLLQGELGAGKSTFARAMIHALGHDGAVPSPTYTLVEPYELPGGTVYHIDLYRVSSEEELRFLGWKELDEGLRIVEWPERVPGITASADVVVALEYRDSGRDVDIGARSPRGQAIVDRLALPPVTEPVD